MTAITVFGDPQSAQLLLKAIDRRDGGFIWDDETVSPDLLQRLTISTARLTSLVPMYNCSFRSLTQLNLSFNRITDVSHLAYLHVLRLLDISHNRIVSIDALRKMSKLTILRCHNNAIEVLEPLIGLTLLEELWISDNKVDWLEFIHLMPLTNLNHFVKANNPCDSKPKMERFIWGLCPSLVTLDGMELPEDVTAAVDFFSTVDGKVMIAQAKSQLTPSLRAQLLPYVERINSYAESRDNASDSSMLPSPKSRRHVVQTQDDISIASSAAATSQRRSKLAAGGSPGRSRNRVQHFKAQHKGLPRKFLPNPETESTVQEQLMQQFEQSQLTHYAAGQPSIPLGGTQSLATVASSSESREYISQPGGLDLAAARRLFSEMDRHRNNAITLRDLVLVARDTGSEASRLLHQLLHLPLAVHQEGDGSKDAIVRLFAELHGPNGETKQGVSFDEWVSYMDSHHFLNKLYAARLSMPQQNASPLTHPVGQLLAIGPGQGQHSSPLQSPRDRSPEARVVTMASVPASRPERSPSQNRKQLLTGQIQESGQRQGQGQGQGQPMYSQVYRFGEDESAPVALCLQDGGSGYARWSKGGSVACSYEHGRIFASYRGGAIAVVLDREGNGSVMDTRGKCVLLVSETGSAKIMDKTGVVLSEERRVSGGASPGASGTRESEAQAQAKTYKWRFDGLTIEFRPETWEIVVSFQNERVACEFSSASGGRMLRDKKTENLESDVLGGAKAGRGKGRFDIDQRFDHAGIQDVTSGLDQIMSGLVAKGKAGQSSSKIPRAVDIQKKKESAFDRKH